MSKSTVATCNKRIIEKINLCYTRIENTGMTMIQEALTAGELLAQVKLTLPHGSWMEWVKNNLKFSHKTATNYMRLYELEQSGQLEIGSSLVDAYKLVMSPPKLATVANLTDSPPPAPRAASVIVDTEIVEPTAPEKPTRGKWVSGAEIIDAEITEPEDAPAMPEDELDPLVVDGTGQMFDRRLPPRIVSDKHEMRANKLAEELEGKSEDFMDIYQKLHGLTLDEIRSVYHIIMLKWIP